MGEQAPPPIPSRLTTFAPPKPSRLFVKEKSSSLEANSSSTSSSSPLTQKSSADVKPLSDESNVTLTNPESTFRREPARPVEVGPPQVPARLTSLGLKKSSPPLPPPSRYRFDRMNYNCNLPFFTMLANGIL